MPKTNIIKSGIVVTLFAAAGIVLNYVFQLVSGRWLSAHDYADMQALFALLTIISVPAGAVTMIVSQMAATSTGSAEKNIKQIYKRNIIYAIYAGALVSALSSLVFIFIKSDLGLSYSDMMIISVVGGIGYITALYVGLLQGLEKFFEFSFSLFLGTIFKLVFGLLFIYLGYKTFGAMLGLLISGTLATAYMHFILNKNNAKEPLSENTKNKEDNTEEKKKISEQIKINNNLNINFKEIKEKFGYAFNIIIINIFLAVFVSADIIFAKYILAPDLVAVYAYISVIGKLPLYVLLSITQVMFPLYARSNIKDSLKYFTCYFSFAIFAGAAAYIFGNYFGHILLPLLMGNKLEVALAANHIGFGFMVFSAIGIIYNFVQLISLKVKSRLYTLTILLICSIIYIGVIYVLIKSLA